MPCRLMQASAADAEDPRIFDMLQDIGRSENGFENGAHGLSGQDYVAYLAGLVDQADWAKLRPGRVPQTSYWLFDGDEAIGFSKLRHYLNPGLRRKGGHIGYGIRSSRRGLGYGRRILALSLEKLADLGVGRALLTCHEENAASRRVIEGNGGILEDSVDGECRYWIGPGEAAARGTLLPMSPSAYAALRLQMIGELAKAKIELGLGEAAARAEAEAEQDAVLPQGVATPAHFLSMLKSPTGEPLGYSWMGGVERSYGPVAFVFDLFVYPERRGEGYGLRLLRDLEGAAAREGYRSVELFVLASNAPARALYAKAGYGTLRADERGAILSKSLDR